jgi:hypothetical protein
MWIYWGKCSINRYLFHYRGFIDTRPHHEALSLYMSSKIFLPILLSLNDHIHHLYQMIQVKPDPTLNLFARTKTDLDPSSNQIDTASVHQSSTPELSVHRVPVTSCYRWSNSVITNLLADSITKGDASGNVVEHCPMIRSPWVFDGWDLKVRRTFPNMYFQNPWRAWRRAYHSSGTITSMYIILVRIHLTTLLAFAALGGHCRYIL